MFAMTKAASGKMIKSRTRNPQSIPAVALTKLHKGRKFIFVFFKLGHEFDNDRNSGYAINAHCFWHFKYPSNIF